jgi:hypothetical protein
MGDLDGENRHRCAPRRARGCRSGLRRAVAPPGARAWPNSRCTIPSSIGSTPVRIRAAIRCMARSFRRMSIRPLVTSPAEADRRCHEGAVDFRPSRAAVAECGPSRADRTRPRIPVVGSVRHALEPRRGPHRLPTASRRPAAGRQGVGAGLPLRRAQCRHPFRARESRVGRRLGGAVSALVVRHAGDPQGLVRPSLPSRSPSAASTAATTDEDLLLRLGLGLGTGRTGLDLHSA